MRDFVIYLPTAQFHGNERLVNPVIKMFHSCCDSRDFHCTENAGHYVHCKKCHRLWRDMKWDGSYEYKELDGKPTEQHDER